MRKCLFTLGIVMGLSAFACRAPAQTYWLLKYQGKSTRTVEGAGGSPVLQTQTVTERTLIEQCAAAHGASTNNLALVLHANSSHLGDSIEVINTLDPNLFRCEVFLLYFQESYTNNTGTVTRKFAYMFNRESSHSRGHAVMHQRPVTTRAKKGPSTTEVVMDIKCLYWLGTEQTSDPAICSGTFTTIGPLERP
jgi:hypothetical protein